MKPQPEIHVVIASRQNIELLHAGKIWSDSTLAKPGVIALWQNIESLHPGKTQSDYTQAKHGVFATRQNTE
jgi:hypothetical protein